MATLVLLSIFLHCLSLVHAGHLNHFHPHWLFRRQGSTPGGPTHPGIAPTCNKYYKIVSGDSCYSVETKFGITHQQFISWNPAVSSDCISNFWPDYSYCVGIAAPTEPPGPAGPTHPGIAPNCNKFHTVVSGDTCNSVEARFGITHAQFIAWNPAVSADCISNFWPNYSYCVGIGTAPTSKSSSSSSKGTTSSSSSTRITFSSSSSVNTTYSTRHPITSETFTPSTVGSAWPPTKTQAGQPSYCNRWHLVEAHHTCNQIYSFYSTTMTKEQLHEWNPALGDDCSGLYFQWWICVGVQIQTTPVLLFPTAPSGEVPLPDTTEFTPSSTPTIDPIFIPSPTAPGVAAGCDGWYQVAQNDTCYNLLQDLEYVSLEQFVQWNPSVGRDCSNLLANYYYCIMNFETPPPPRTAPPTPSPISGGNPGNCTAWYQMTGSDTCKFISEIFGTFNEAEFKSWNPSVGSACDGLIENVWYCVAIPGTPTTRTAPIPTSTEPPPGMDPLPQQPGIKKDCTKHWLVSSLDDCYTIVYANGVPHDKFLEWNPALGGFQCPGLEEGYYVCVGADLPSTTTPGGGSSSTSPPPPSPTISSTSPTSSVAPVTTPTPHQPGLISGCRRFYLVPAGGGCWDIANKAGISLNDFYLWNPGVSSDCSTLWPNYYVCIGIAGPTTTISIGPPVPTA